MIINTELVALGRESPSIVILTEVELTASDLAAVETAFPGYDAFYPSSSDNTTTRVLALVRQDIEVQHLTSFEAVDVPAVWLRFPGQRFILGGIYRQFTLRGERSRALEWDQLQQIVNMIRSVYSVHGAEELGLIGDFNLDMAKCEESTYSRAALLRHWMEAMDKSGLSWLPTGPTFRSFGVHNGAHHTSILDHMYVTPRLADSASVHVLDKAITDHFPLEVILNLRSHPSLQRSQLPRVQVRDFANLDYAGMNEELENLGVSSWPSPPPGMHPDDILSDILSILCPVLNKYAPVKEVRVRSDTSPLFLATDTRAAIAARDMARSEMGNNSGKYRALRNRVVQLVRRDRANTAANSLQTATDRQAAAWTLAKNLLKPRRPLPVLGDAVNDDTSANVLNRFYVDKVEKLRSTMAPADLPTAATPTPVPTARMPLELCRVGLNTVRRCIKQANNTRALGHDGLPVMLWKRLPALAVPVMHLVNASITVGEVPAAFKYAIIHPVLKKGKDPSVAASYRPVAILPAVSKVLELVVGAQMRDYLEENGLLPAEQHGFRAGRSTLTALASATLSWSAAAGRGNVVGIMAYDFSSAFDTVTADTVVKALGRLGAADNTLRWVSSYMAGGKQ